MIPSSSSSMIARLEKVAFRDDAFAIRSSIELWVGAREIKLCPFSAWEAMGRKLIFFSRAWVDRPLRPGHW